METITNYELLQSLKAIQGIIERIPKAIGIEIDDTGNSAIEDTIGKINRTLEACKQFEATLDARQNEICKQIDAAYHRVKNARELMNMRLSELPIINMTIDRNELKNIEYMVEVAQKLFNLPETTWVRFLELAKTMVGETR